MHRNLLGTILLMLFAFGLSACEKNVESSSKEAVDKVDMMPVPVQAPSSDSDDAQDESVGMTLEGMFRYMADAALFRDCRSGKAFPVAMEAKYIDLERAYLDSDVEPGSEIMVRLRARYLERTGIRRLLVEGGGTLVEAMLRAGLVDEIQLFVAPMILGGQDAPTPVDGAGFTIDDAQALRLIESKVLDDSGLVLRYLVGPHTGAEPALGARADLPALAA